MSELVGPFTRRSYRDAHGNQVEEQRGFTEVVVNGRTMRLPYTETTSAIRVPCYVPKAKAKPARRRA
jgi:hypothetical protein